MDEYIGGKKRQDKRKLCHQGNGPSRVKRSSWMTKTRAELAIIPHSASCRFETTMALVALIQTMAEGRPYYLPCNVLWYSHNVKPGNQNEREKHDIRPMSAKEKSLSARNNR